MSLIFLPKGAVPFGGVPSAPPQPQQYIVSQQGGGGGGKFVLRKHDMMLKAEQKRIKAIQRDDKEISEIIMTIIQTGILN